MVRNGLGGSRLNAKPAHWSSRFAGLEVAGRFKAFV